MVLRALVWSGLREFFELAYLLQICEECLNLETFKAEEFLCLFSGYSMFFTSYSQALKVYPAQGTEAKTLWKSDKEKG